MEIMEKEQIESIVKANIYQRIHAITAELGKVQQSLNVATKTDKNGRVISSYKAVSINDVVDSALPLLEKYRVVVYPVAKDIIKDEQITTTTNYGERTNFFVRMKVTYRFVNIDKPDEYIDVIGYGDGIDTGDKANGKANTYARKYALIDALNISKGDDPDVEKSAEYKPSKKKEMIAQVAGLYTDSEINGMLSRIGKSKVEDLTEAQLQKMVDARSGINAKVETF